MKTIVVPLDGSLFSERALPYAVDLAKLSGARVLLVRAADTSPGLPAVVDPINAKFDALEAAETELAATLTRLGSTDCSLESHVYSGDAARAIIDAAALNDADLIVMASHGRDGVGRFVLGSVADKVIRESHIPVLLVPLSCESSWEDGQTRRILIALDGSALAEGMVDAVIPLARALDAELMLLRVVPSENTSLDEVSDAQRYLDAFAQPLREQGWRVRTLAVKGRPAEMISSFAREMDARVIALATHGRGGIARLVMGSVAAEVLHHCTTPLLVFRPVPVHWRPLVPVAHEGEGSGRVISLQLSEQDVRLATEALQLLLASTEKEEHLAEPLHNLLQKLTTSALETAPA